MTRALALALLVVAQATAQDGVTTEEVKKFLDPTVMIHSFGYSFGANYLANDAERYTHTLQPTWAFNHWTAVWADVPITRLSPSDGQSATGVGDTLIGWGAVIHEDLSRRFTSSAAWLEALAPTGDRDKRLGAGTWVLAPGAAAAFNFTDHFPIYVSGRYLHSLGETETPVRSLQFNFETVHIMPKGFFISVLPDFIINFNRDQQFFALGVGAGRALNRNFALKGNYTHHIVGSKTFNQVVSIQLRFIWGEAKTGGGP